MVQPNLIFILTDDQGYGDLGCNGNTEIKTPHIDALHAESARFTDYHVGTTCAPTRAGLLTGHHCNSTGVWHTIGGRSLLREDEWSLADALKESGYRTGLFGKWHLGDAQPFRPHERGFEKAIYHGGGAIGNAPDAWGNDYFDDTYFVNGEPQKFEGYCTDIFFDEAIKFIEANKDEPFYCHISPNAPHGPLNVEPRYRELYSDAPDEGRARFYGMITNIDENVGKLRAKLNDLGLSENTIVVFMTDNGTASGVKLDRQGHVIDEGPYNYNVGMRGNKVWEYEGGHRVPFFLHYPEVLGREGIDFPELTSYIDFMPTVLDLCNIQVPPERTFHGTSLAPLLQGKAMPELEERAIVSDTQRLARPVKWRRSSVMKGSWRLVNGTELYDISKDPGQTINVINEHPDRVSELREAYEAWWLTVSEQFDRDVPFAIGGSDETVALTTHDIRNEAHQTAFNQDQIRAGYEVAGYWAVDVRKAGRYSIELRRWAKSTGYKMRDGIDGDDCGWRKDCVDERRKGLYEGGKALDLNWASITIADETHHAEVPPEADSVRFDVTLPEGETQLYAGLYDGRRYTRAPYYIYIDRK